SSDSTSRRQPAVPSPHSWDWLQPSTPRPPVKVIPSRPAEPMFAEPGTHDKFQPGQSPERWNLTRGDYWKQHDRAQSAEKVPEGQTAGDPARASELLRLLDAPAGPETDVAGPPKLSEAPASRRDLTDPMPAGPDTDAAASLSKREIELPDLDVVEPV